MTQTNENEMNTFLCDDTGALKTKPLADTGVKSTGADYADDFVKKFMTESSSAEFEPDVEKGAADAPLSARILEENVVLALKQIYDPEIPINIYDLGLIYKVSVSDKGEASVDMTLTSPGCPVAQTFPGQVECAILAVDGVESAVVELVWDPPWTKDRMSQAALLSLGLL